jgi:hypothetical protein
VGEEEAGELAYLCYTSRLRPHPHNLSIIFQGPSGAGKDVAQRRPALLMPPEDVLDFTSITPNALYYNDEGWLKHKILLGGERSHKDDEEQRDKTGAIRMLLGNGRIVKATVDNNLQTRTIKQEGPVSYSETTTKLFVFKEDANRCLLVHVDASKEQTKRVLHAQAQERLPGPHDPDKAAQEALDRHHEFQRSLEDVDVRIPFATNITDGLPCGKVEVRRYNAHLLALIEVVAFLRQLARPRNAWGQLEATYEDYEVARRLILGPLQAAGFMDRQYARCGALEKQLSPLGLLFSTPQAAEAFGIDRKDRKMTKDALDLLGDWGIIEPAEKGAGSRPTRWRRTGKTAAESILPSAATLRQVCVTCVTGS